MADLPAPARCGHDDEHDAADDSGARGDHDGLEPLARQTQAVLAGLAAGRLSRRSAIQRLGLLGLPAPLAVGLLADAGLAQAQPAAAPPAAPGRRGSGGTLRLIYWQGPVQLNPHLASGSKDQDAMRLFYEPLARYDADGELEPVLAAEIPSRANGGLAADGTSVTWKLKTGVRWHDGKPFTADDVLFTAAYAADGATGAVSQVSFRNVQFEKLDSHTVRLRFPEPRANWRVLVGAFGCIIPRHVFEPYAGARSREAPANTRPVGTGPYRLLDFRPGDSITAEANPDYHVPGQPFFGRLELKGGGDALSAARTVLQTGEYDFAWNTAAEDDLLKRLEASGRGRLLLAPGCACEFIVLNRTDPWSEVDGERASPLSKHPAFHDAALRQALALLVDRRSIAEQIYGRAAQASANYLDHPARYRSPNNRFEFNPDKAAQVLDAAGWRRGADGLRSKDGTALKLVFQCATSQPRQKTQAIVKDACARAGIALELKAVLPAVFFGNDPANPDTLQKFWADLQMLTWNNASPDPQNYMAVFVSAQLAHRGNKWSNLNFSRFADPEFDRLWYAAQTELDPARRAAQFIRMNDLLVQSGWVLPIFSRVTTHAAAANLKPVVSPWDNTTSAIGAWSRSG